MSAVAPLTRADLPVPVRDTAFMDNNRRIWLFLLDPPSPSGKWRDPNGNIIKPSSHVLDIALAKHGVTKLRKMLPVRG